MKRKSRVLLEVEILEKREVLSTFFVSTAGNDGDSGLAGHDWATLTKAAQTVQAGDSVTVRAGNYAGFDLTTSGTATQRIQFLADPGVFITAPETMRGKDGINLEGASYIDVQGFNASNTAEAGIRSVTNTGVNILNNTCDHNVMWGVFTGFSDNVRVEANTCTRSQVQHGIYISNSCVNPIVRGNIVWGNSNSGIHMNGDISQGGPGVITNALVEDNVIHDNGVNGGSGINCDGVQNSVFRDNLLYDNHASGISLYRIDAADGAKDNVIVNNTIVMASDSRWALNIQNGSTGNVAFNNILWNNASHHGSVSISADSLIGFVSDDNVVMDRFTTDDGNTRLTLAQWQAATGQDQHSLLAAPEQLFANVAGNDYHLASTSPAIDRGVASLSGKPAPSLDLDGKPRPSGSAYDVGAYETQTGTPLDQPPTVATPAAATPTPVTGKTTTLSVLGADSGGEVNLTYTWTVTALPAGAATPIFSLNASNAAKNTTATFAKAGSYTFVVTISDGGLSTTSQVSVVVDQTLTSIVVSPGTTSVAVGGTRQYNASAHDQFGDSLLAQPAFTWKVSKKGGQISRSGLYTAPSASGAFTITASAGGVKGSARVTVTKQAAFKAAINFGLASEPVPTGYLADSGAIFANRGNGYSYGWNTNITDTGRDRDAANSPDERYDTFLHMQKPAHPNAFWEIAVPNGTYTVHVVAGDPTTSTAFTRSTWRARTPSPARPLMVSAGSKRP